MKSVTAPTQKSPTGMYPAGLDHNIEAVFKPAALLGRADNPDRIGSSRGSNRPCGF
jgi:hypothetical protein